MLECKEKEIESSLAYLKSIDQLLIGIKNNGSQNITNDIKSFEKIETQIYLSRLKLKKLQIEIGDKDVYKVEQFENLIRSNIDILEDINSNPSKDDLALLFKNQAGLRMVIAKINLNLQKKLELVSVEKKSIKFDLDESLLSILY